MYVQKFVCTKTQKIAKIVKNGQKNPVNPVNPVFFLLLSARKKNYIFKRLYEKKQEKQDKQDKYRIFVRTKISTLRKEAKLCGFYDAI